MNLRAARKILWGAVVLLVSSSVAVSAASGEPDVGTDAAIEIPELFDLRPVTRSRIYSFSVTQPNPASWGLDRIDQVELPLDNLYQNDNDGSGVKVYVVDSGIRRTHEDFEARVATGYAAPLTRETTTDDCNGHGTHVAGTVGGASSGVAKRVTIVPVRVFDCGGDSRETWLIQGLRWIIEDHKPGEPAVANLSLGANGNFPTVDQAVRDLVADGVTVVVAAGNSNVYLDPASSEVPSPSCVSEAIIVGASDTNDAEWYESERIGSNYGGCVDL